MCHKSAGKAENELCDEGRRSRGGIADQDIADGQADGAGESAVFTAEQKGRQHDEGRANIDFPRQAADHGDLDAQVSKADEGHCCEHCSQGEFQDFVISHGYHILSIGFIIAWR